MRSMRLHRDTGALQPSGVAGYGGDVVSREWAVKVVEAHLASRPPQADPDRTLVVVGTEEYRFGWFVYIQCVRWVRTRSHRDLLAGPGYFLVDGLDGSLHHMNASANRISGSWIQDYLEEVRGVPHPDPLRPRGAETSPPAFSARHRVTGPNPEPVQ
ncbi:YrhB domain-containing protein [Catenulispora pinistramenti]|uniref:YrhB domain-containing protein n=1 Tax=Catenulispora pinistramenti TaxID=2705254 RepID=UPI001BA98631|nr:YrhB domain-containing protein [Catenulispora pinistramenti]